MAEEKVTLVVESTGTEATSTEVKSVGDAFRQLDAQIKGIRSSADAFDVQKAKLNGMKDALIDGQKEAAKLGEKGKEAGEKFATALKKIDVELDKIEKESVRSITPLERAFQNAEAAVAQFNQRAQGESGATTRDVERLWRQQELLNIELEKSEKEYGELGEEAKARLGEINAATEEAVVTVRRTNDAVADQRGKLQEAGEQWKGLGQSIQDAAGPMGEAVGRIGLITAAFTSGWQAGQKLNSIFGTDMSEWDRQVEVSGKSIGLALRQLSDEFVATAMVIKEVGDVMSDDYAKRVTEAWKNLREVQARASKDYNAEAEAEIEKAQKTAQAHVDGTTLAKNAFSSKATAYDAATQRIIDKELALQKVEKSGFELRQEAIAKTEARLMELMRVTGGNGGLAKALEIPETVFGKWDQFNEILKRTEDQARKTAAAVMSISTDDEVESISPLGRGDRLVEPS